MRAGVALGAVLATTAAQGQTYGAYPPGYSPQYANAQYADPRYVDPRNDPRYQAWLRWYYQRYYGQAYSQAYPAYPPPAPPAASPPPLPAVTAQLAPPDAATPAIAPPPPPPPAVAETAPPPPAPAIAEAAPAQPAADDGSPAPRLPHRLIEAAQAYADYVARTSAIHADFTSGAAVADAVKTGAAYEMHQFQEGAIAYAALTALQEPTFVQAVRQQVLAGDRGAGFAAELSAHPDDALSLQGADLAAARASSALRRHGEHLVNAGSNVKQAAYTVQHSAWSKSQVADPDGRLAAAKASSGVRRALQGDEAPELVQAILAEPAADGQPVASPIVTRALAVAALAALGQLQGDDDPRLVALMAEPKSADCLKMAKLNLFQCLSVARPHYEDIFCLGEHAMRETGQCVVRAAGYTPIPPPPAAVAAATTEAASR